MAEPRTTPGTTVALTIAGSDCSGGAGLQADLKTFTVMRVYGASVVTAITAQNTRGVKRSEVLAPDLVEAQLDAVGGDLDPHAVKTGMLGSAEVVARVAAAIRRHQLYPLVVDPVMVSKRGDELVDEKTIDRMQRELFKEAALLTPNRQEAARLVARAQPIEDAAAAGEAAREICHRFGARACLVTGLHRHSEETDQAIDILYDGTSTREFASDWYSTDHTHGAGCTLSAAITGALAGGAELEAAIETGRHLVAESIRQATDLGQGRSPVNPMAWLDVK